MINLVWQKRLLLLLALLTAALLRLWALGILPLGLYHDEAYNGLDALSLTEGRTFPIFHEAWELYALEAHGDRPPLPQRAPIFFEGNYGREPLHVYLMAVAIIVFGPTPLAIRLVPALAGVLGVWTTYLAVGALLPATHRRSLAPAAAALTLAVMFPAVHFSRFGLRVMLFVPLSTMCIAFFWWAVNLWLEKREIDWAGFVLAGLLLGGGLYVYAAGRLFPLLFILFIPLLLWHQRTHWRRLIRPLLLMAGISLVVALPLLLYFARYPYFFFFRIGYVANRGQGTVAGRPLLTWLNNVPRVVRGLFWRGETHFRHNLPGRPFIDGLQTAAFAWGGWTLTRFVGISQRWLRLIFLIMWLGVMLLPTILSGDAPHFGRMVGAMPVVAIIVGWGIADVARRLPAGWAFAVLVTLPLASGLWTSYGYFYRYQNHPLMQVDFDAPDWATGQALGAYPNADPYVTPTQPETATMMFALAGRREELRLLNLDQTLITAGRPGVPAVFAVPRDEPAVRNRLRAELAIPEHIYDGGETAGRRLLIIDSPDPRFKWDRSVNHLFDDKIELLGMAVGENEDEGEVKVTLTWRAERTMTVDYTAFVHLLDGDGQIVAQLDRQPAGYPTSDWRADEWMQDTFVIPWPENRPPNWSLRTGFYNGLTQEPLGSPIAISN